MTKIQTAEVKEQGYNEMPYNSYPFDYNRPESLHGLMHLFGIKSPALEKTRILEMGCADGGNLLKFAVDFPKAEIVGIDLSEKQIQLGQKRIKDMGLKNYQLKHMSITDLDESMGKFDYIICHGVYSWVPDFVQESILSNCGKLLSDTGAAFVSYNTLPGWNMNKTIRDLMIYHSRNFENVKDRVEQARLALDFVCDTLKDADTPYAKFLRKTANDLRLKEDHYLRHEFLADENSPCYFHEFITDIAKHDLAYVGDTDYQRMNVQNLPEKASELLSQVTDITRTEQYTDFIMNSTFRCSVLCKKDNVVNRNISTERLKQFVFSSNMNCLEEYTDSDILSDKILSFSKKEDENLKLSTGSPEQKAIITTLMAQKLPISYDAIVEKTHGKFNNLDKNIIEQNLAASIGRLIFTRHIEFFSYAPNYVTEISDKPKIHDVNLYRFKNNIPSRMCWVTSSINRTLVLDATFVHFLEFFDGKHTADQITEEMRKLIENDVLKLEQDGKAITDKKLISQSAKDLYNFASKHLLDANLLVS